MFERYATEPIAARQRIRRWCEFGASTLSPIAVRPYEPDAFTARILRGAIGDLGLSQVQTTPAHAVGSDTARDGGAGQGAVIITLQQAGRSRVLQAGREVTMGPGDVVMLDLRRRWEVDDFQSSVHLQVKIPVARFVACVGDPAPYFVSPLRAGDARTTVLSSVIENIGRLVFASNAELQPDAVTDLLFSATRIAFDRAPQGTAAGGDTEQFRRDVFRFVDERLQDPGTSVAGLATALGMSLRSFQRVFYQSGTSPRRYILTRRIESAAARLRESPSAGKARITEVALASGFNDPGYFSRVFVHHLGLTPTEFLRKYRSVS